MNSVIVSMTTDGYMPYTLHFYTAIRLNNKHKIVMYLTNVDPKKQDKLQKFFPDIEFIKWDQETPKWHGIDCVPNMKPVLMENALAKEKKHIIWIDNSKLILCNLGWIDNNIDKYDGVFLKRGGRSPKSDYWAGILAMNKNGLAIQKYKELIKSDLLTQTKGGWQSDQEALFYLECNKLDLNYKDYVSDTYDDSFPILRNKPIVMPRNIKKEVVQKNVDALQQYNEILKKKVFNYETLNVEFTTNICYEETNR